MLAAEKREQLPSGGALAFGFQYPRSVSAQIVDIAMPAALPVPVTKSFSAAAAR